MKYLYQSIIISALCMLPSCAQTKIDDSRAAGMEKLRDESKVRVDNHREYLEKKYDAINHASFDEIVLISKKVKSFDERVKKSLEGTNIYYYNVKVVLNDAQKQELLRIVREELEIPKNLDSPLNVKYSFSGNRPRFHTVFRFYQNGKLSETLDFEKIGGRVQNRMCDCAADYVHEPRMQFYYSLDESSYIKLENLVKKLNKLYRADVD